MVNVNAPNPSEATTAPTRTFVMGAEFNGPAKELNSSLFKNMGRLYSAAEAHHMAPVSAQRSTPTPRNA